MSSKKSMKRESQPRKSPGARRQEAVRKEAMKPVANGDQGGAQDEFDAELDSFVRESFGIKAPVKPRTQADVQAYFKDWLKRLNDGADELLGHFHEHHRKYRDEISDAECDKELAATLLSYWRGNAPFFESHVRRETLESEVELLDTKEYRAVRDEIEMRIELCARDIAKDEKRAEEKWAEKGDGSKSRWLGTDAQLTALAQWLFEREKIDATGKDLLPNVFAGKSGSTKIEWRGTQPELAVLCRWLKEKRLIGPNWVKFAKSRFVRHGGGALSKHLSVLAMQAEGRSAVLQTWQQNLDANLRERLS